jgi:hypothetical protein
MGILDMQLMNQVLLIPIMIVRGKQLVKLEYHSHHATRHMSSVWKDPNSFLCVI